MRKSFIIRKPFLFSESLTARHAATATAATSTIRPIRICPKNIRNF